MVVDILFDESIWVVIPAAGVGSRMQSNVPKQYLKIIDKTVLDHTISKFLALKKIAKIVVCLNQSDAYWQNSVYRSHSRVVTVWGGECRSESVLNGLHYISHFRSGAGKTWVLVHDAARPCITIEKINQLINVGISQESGAILAIPVSDTVKRISKGEIEETLDRSQLWLAQTPQIFKLESLLNALEVCKQKKLTVTDEASAIENLGGKVHLVVDRKDNIKITVPEDLSWAQHILFKQKNSGQKL